MWVLLWAGSRRPLYRSIQWEGNPSPTPPPPVSNADPFTNSNEKGTNLQHGNLYIHDPHLMLYAFIEFNFILISWAFPMNSVMAINIKEIAVYTSCSDSSARHLYCNSIARLCLLTEHNFTAGHVLIWSRYCPGTNQEQNMMVYWNILVNP